MLARLSHYFHILKALGPRNIGYRLYREFLKRSGVLERQTPQSPASEPHLELREWRQSRSKFFFGSAADLSMPRVPCQELEEKIERYHRGELQFFHGQWLETGFPFDWLRNPLTGYRYSASQPWFEIETLSAEAGDIKYVWELSRFCFLQDLIRYDYHHRVDCSERVFEFIESWIDSNPINRGPNYVCSQEISLRLLNWLFALYYYRDSPALTESRFQSIWRHLYWQLEHVDKTIGYSLNCVRNNHALTESLTLLVFGLLFPQIPQASRWKSRGRRYFQREVLYQVYADGTYIQFSHNYHRVALQLMVWGIALSRLNGEPLDDRIVQRALRSVGYLYQCQVDENGFLPNYGNNDGALFFSLSRSQFRDFRPALGAAATLLCGSRLYPAGPWEEEAQWLNLDKVAGEENEPRRESLALFPVGGYAALRDGDTLTFLRCGRHRDRPGQADNLHLDIWVAGENLLRDQGSFLYNADPETLEYFAGGLSHNSVMLGDHSQMSKGPRFVWTLWSQAQSLEASSTEESWVIEGRVLCFRQLGKKIHHTRLVKKRRGKLEWLVTDSFNDNAGLPLRQIWHASPRLKISSDGQRRSDGENWSSWTYGVKGLQPVTEFETERLTIETLLEVQA